MTTAFGRILAGIARFSLPGPSVGKNHQGIEVATNVARTRIVGNTIVEAGTGIRFAGLMPEQRVQRALHCVNPAGEQVARFCASDADCFIPDIDASAVGVCPALPTDIRDLRARGTTAEGNTLVGPFNSTTPARAAIFGEAGTVGGIIRANQIFGTGIEPGIAMAGFTIETGQVIGNVVRGASFGLMRQQSTATAFGAPRVPQRHHGQHGTCDWRDGNVHATDGALVGWDRQLLGHATAAILQVE